MKETQKTLLFAAAALLVVAVAYLTGPSTAKQEAGEVRGQLLFPTFTDPMAVTRMEIMRFDDASRKFLPFEVAEVKAGRKGAEKVRWSIPSHGDYPADAKDHLAEAATSLMGLKIADYASREDLTALDQAIVRQRHNEYGVIDPDPESVKTTDTGVGMRVAMKDKGGNALLAMIIGKPLGGEQPNLHYVRRVGQDPVFVVEVDPGKLSTKFEDWIEKNLLKLNAMDLKEVEIDDYTFNIVGDRPDVKIKGQLKLQYNGSGEPHWKLTENVGFGKANKPVDRKLADDEELDAKKLDDLKLALDDLKIVDVNRKPPGLSQDLRASGDYAKDLLGAQSLMERGFYFVPAQEKGDKIYYQLLSNKGEVRLEMSDGVEYVLRFGEVAGEPSAASAKPSAKAKEKTPAKKDDSTPGMNRYLFVMAEFNPDGIAKPVMETRPEEKAEEKAEGGGRKAEGKKDDAKTEAAKKDEPKKDDGKKEEAKKDATKKEPAVKAEKKPDLKAERQRIEKENKRKQEEYDEKVTQGKQHVKDLNARFAEWYYVISDDVYRKIHLGRDEIVKKKEKKEKDADGKDKPAGHVHGPDDGHDHGDGAKPPPAPEPEKGKTDAPPDAME